MVVNAMMIAELSQRLQVSGGCFNYAYTTIGEFPGWLIGWLTIMRTVFATCSISRTLQNYFNGLLKKFDVEVPEWMKGVEFLGVEKCSIMAVIYLLIVVII